MRVPIALVLGIILIPALGLAGTGSALAQPLQVSPVPLWGIVLGTVIVAGLLYLIVHGPDGGYYRYPYYGEYYRHYYHPWYRPYAGFYPAAAPVIIVAPPVLGLVLGVVVINHVQYILSRDGDGHLYRYPYYGPYRQVYYRPAYHEYHGEYITTGAYTHAPVREGDPRWDTDRRNLAPAYQRPPQPQWHPNAPDHPGAPNQTHYPQQQPYGSQSGGRGDSGGPRNRQQQCGHRGEPPCPSNGQHP